MKDVVCIGEALVDFVPSEAGGSLAEIAHWRRGVGGSAANVSVGLSRLGSRAALLGVVGDDGFGEFLFENLGDEGVDVSRLRVTDQGSTGLVFISIDERGERSFFSSMTRAAEYFLDEQDADLLFLDDARALYFGTSCLLFRAAQRALLKMLTPAREAGKLLVLDPNLRLHLWPDPAELKAVLSRLLPLSHVVKLSEEELDLATGTTDPEQALEALSALGVALPIVTLGDKGALLRWGGKVMHVVSPEVTAVDTTGAGDAFMAGLLHVLTRLCPDAGALQRLGVGEVREAVAFGCKVGARVVAERGATEPLPDAAQMEAALPRFLRS